ncbi:hypothetical protein CHUAL_011956 [Chamberlinius hualienensis]
MTEIHPLLNVKFKDKLHSQLKNCRRPKSVFSLAFGGTNSSQKQSKHKKRKEARTKSKLDS